MSDARWIDVNDDVADASEHFRKARALHAGRTAATELEEYRDRMALMHALQSAHTSAEAALVRILRILNEDPPSGDDWHQKLISRMSRSLIGEHERPAILSTEVADDLDETRRFRNRAARSYGTFDPGKMGPTLAAAERLETSFGRDIALFRRAVDPD